MSAASPYITATMKRIRTGGLSARLLSQGARPVCLRQQSLACRRLQSTAAASNAQSQESSPSTDIPVTPSRSALPPSPFPEAALNSAKLAALHARLSLPESLPLQTLARTLVDSSADPNPDFNNTALVKVGRLLVANHVTEYLMTKYPRLPVNVLHEAMAAYAAPKSLSKIAKEWGVETAAFPGAEVDPGLLQFSLESTVNPETVNAMQRPGPAIPNLRRTLSSRVVYDDEFGENPIVTQTLKNWQNEDQAYANFVWALTGALHVHAGRAAAAHFIKGHILSRTVDLTRMFHISSPPRHLNRLCAREDFEYPVARILSETGRQSRHPVYVVGVFSGQNKLGEGAAGNLNEARTRAAVAAIKSWYLYSPSNEPRVPSDTELEGERAKAPWKPAHIDVGEIVV